MFKRYLPDGKPAFEVWRLGNVMSLVQRQFANHYGAKMNYEGSEVSLDSEALTVRMISSAELARTRRRSSGRARNPRSCFHFDGRFYQIAFHC